MTNTSLLLVLVQERNGIYRFSTQRRHEKTIGCIEKSLARDSTTSIKFNGKLEPFKVTSLKFVKNVLSSSSSVYGGDEFFDPVPEPDPTAWLHTPSRHWFYRLFFTSLFWWDSLIYLLTAPRCPHLPRRYRPRKS